MIQRIAEHGPVSFKWFMDKALYHPEFGYYSTGRAAVGKSGDFYTNVSVGRIYGDLLAKQFEEMWERLGKPQTFVILEQGAHHGQFANDVLTWIQNFSPEFFRAVRYWIVEPSEKLQHIQQQRLECWPPNRVRWVGSLEHMDAGSMMGVHFSNELLDAFPVHLLSFVGDEWVETFVDYEKGKFKMVYLPLSTPVLEQAAAKLPNHGIQQYKTEVNTAMLRWIEDAAKVIARGYVLTVDYGFTRSQYYCPERSEGTLRCYHQHHQLRSIFEKIGEADMTAHVDWTSLAEAGEQFGLKVEGFVDQHHFMVGLGEEELLTLEREVQEMTPELEHYLRCFKSLMHPETMGSTFKALCMSKNVPGEVPLLGFRYGSDHRKALELPENLPSKTGLTGYEPI